MSGSAIALMVLAMVVVWGGLALAVWNLSRGSATSPMEEVRRDL